ncbi:hypothetical protein [Streptomyces bohaiensis]|uniref:hypothetical protein n=1 Tax=Streptomyces bohaiensis TaxID=1431344 RepID=UPI003B7CD2FE
MPESPTPDAVQPPSGRLSTGPLPTRFVRCPPGRPDLRPPHAVDPDYAFTLPSALATPELVREAVESVLGIHDISGRPADSLPDIAYELVWHACRFTPEGDSVHLTVRRHAGAFHLAVHDTHERHRHSQLNSRCDARRERSFHSCATLVADHHGTCGTSPAVAPTRGTLTLLSLPTEPEPDPEAEARPAVR